MKNILPVILIGAAAYFLFIKKKAETKTPGTDPGNTSLYGRGIKRSGHGVGYSINNTRSNRNSNSYFMV